MSTRGQPVSILILTEDTAGDAFATLQAIVQKMLYLLDPQSDVRRIRFEPADERARAAMAWNGWDGKDHRKQVDLRQTILTRLLRGEDAFVILHMDGDCAWSTRGRSLLGPHKDRFDALILPGIQMELARRQQEGLLRRLLFLVPFYSIEAWLYQNTEEALLIYEERHPHAQEDIDRFHEWQQDPGALDEVLKPKDLVRIGGKHNLRLAHSRFPAQKLFQVGKSFTQAIESTRGCPQLIQALMTLRFASRSG